jgi:hypothetical protein
MQLTIGTSIIPLNAGTNLPMVLRSPLFITDKGNIPGSYIFNFQVPAGNAIRKEFGQAHRIQRHGRATAELPYIITDGLLRFAGNAVVTQATTDSYEVACKIDNGDLTSRLNQKTLKDLDWGDDIVIADLGIAASNEMVWIAVNQSSLLFLFSFSTVYIDLNDNLSFSSPIGASVFTAKSDGSVKMSLRFNLSDTDIKNYGVRLYKNYSINEEFPLLYGSNEIISEQTVQTGDIFYWGIYAEKKSEGMLRYRLTEIFATFQSSNVFNEVVTMDQDSSDFTIFPIHNKNMLANFPDDAFQIDNLSIKTIYSEYFPVLNYYKDNEFPLFLSGIVEEDPVYCANLFTPFIYMRSILNKIASESGYAIENSPFDAEFKNMVLFNAYAENTYTIDSTALLPLKATFNLADHVPEMAQNDFLKWVSLLTGYMPVVDNNLQMIRFVDMKNKNVVSPTNLAVPFPGTLLELPQVKTDPEYAGIKFELKKAGTDQHLETIKDLNEKLIYKGAVSHISNLPTSGNKVNDMYLVTVLNEYYVYQYNPEVYMLTWWFFSKKFPILYTEGKETFLQISTELCPMLTSKMQDETLSAPENRTWTIPQTEQAGILEGFPDSLGAEYGLQVLYYKGMVNDSLAQPYPLGSCRMSDYASNPDGSPDISADGIFNARYKAFLQWLAYETKPVTIKSIMTRAQLRKIRYDQIYSGTGFNFLVKEIRVNMGVDGLSQAEMDIYTC